MSTFEKIQREKILGSYWNASDIVKSYSDRLSETPKFKKVMEEWRNGTLRSSNGDRVTSQSQALAIAFSEAESVRKAQEEVIKKTLDKEKEESEKGIDLGGELVKGEVGEVEFLTEESSDLGEVEKGEIDNVDPLKEHFDELSKSFK